MALDISRVRGDIENKIKFTRETLAHLHTIEDVAMFATTTLFSVIPAHKIAVAVIEGNLLKSMSTLGKRVFIDLSLDKPSINARTVRTRQTQLVNDTSTDPDYYPGDPNENMSSELCVPLIYRNKILGTINFEHLHPGRFTEEDIRVAEAFAGEIAESVHRVYGDGSLNRRPMAQGKKVRSVNECYFDLLKAVHQGESVANKILNRVAIQWKPGKELINNLMDKGYLVREKRSANRYAYRITEEGVNALKAYESIIKQIGG